ncbi:MAG: hypothetical protein ACXADB_05370 [Candidatus Hermodarchaeia archaeon]|jgi:hypothetical protein
MSQRESAELQESIRQGWSIYDSPMDYIRSQRNMILSILNGEKFGCIDVHFANELVMVLNHLGYTEMHLN